LILVGKSGTIVLIWSPDLYGLATRNNHENRQDSGCPE
jgi:hypothetical protein